MIITASMFRPKKPEKNLKQAIRAKPGRKLVKIMEIMDDILKMKFSAPEAGFLLPHPPAPAYTLMEPPKKRRTLPGDSKNTVF